MRILLVDDHSMVRSGLRLLLEEQDDFRVAGEAGDVDGALERTRALGPDVILLDLNMPGGASGFVLKEAADSELVEAVRAAAAGRTYVNPSLGARLATAAGPAAAA